MSENNLTISKLKIGNSVANLKDSQARSDLSNLATVASTGDYDNLINKPSIPTKISDLTNDSNFIESEDTTSLQNNDLLAWNSSSSQLIHITRPTVNDTVLKAIVSNGVVTGYTWGSSGGSGGTSTGVAFYGTRAQYNTAKLIPEGQSGYIPSGALVIITDEDDMLIGDEQ